MKQQHTRFWTLVIQYAPITTMSGAVHVPSPQAINYVNELAAHSWAGIYSNAGVTASHMIIPPNGLTVIPMELEFHD